VRAYTKQEFTVAETTARLQVRKGRARLPQRPVTEVGSVVDVNGTDVAYTLAGETLLLDPTVPDPWAWEPRRSPVAYVDVTYTHGYETIPEVIVAIVCQVAARAYGSPSNTAGTSQETIGSYSHTTGITAAAGPVGLLPAERSVLDDYLRVGGLAYYSP
jgi:hypothetical protein